MVEDGEDIRSASIADAITQVLTGGGTIDTSKTEDDLTSCKNAINSIILALEKAGIIADN